MLMIYTANEEINIFLVAKNVTCLLAGLSRRLSLAMDVDWAGPSGQGQLQSVAVNVACIKELT